jgi:hypothetical protein
MEMRLISRRGSKFSRVCVLEAACERFWCIPLVETTETKLLAEMICSHHEFILGKGIQLRNELP